MKLLPNMKECKTHVMYPARFDKCPSCYKDAKSTKVVFTPEQIKKFKDDDRKSYVKLSDLDKS